MVNIVVLRFNVEFHIAAWQNVDKITNADILHPFIVLTPPNSSPKMLGDWLGDWLGQDS
jgi:hypothetical protein